MDQANIHISWAGIFIAVFANFLLGFLWYTPLFGKVWAREIGMDTTQKPPSGSIAKGMIMMIIGNFLLAFVFSHNIAAWYPPTWGLPAPTYAPYLDALPAAMFTWAGFFLPTDLSTVAWEGRSWKFFFINTGYHLLNLLVVAMILVYFR